jgi:hypothetical protein
VSPEQDDGQATVARFRQTLRTVKLLWRVTILGCLICLGAGIYAFAVHDRYAGAGLMFIGWVLLMIVSGIYAAVFRCPACGAGLDRHELSPWRCRKCGAALQA